MLYFDTSFLVPMVLAESTSEKVERFLDRQSPGELAVSYWTRLEFASLLAREVRMGELEPEVALDADAEFEALVNKSFMLLLPRQEDYEVARRYVQHYRTGLRAGDALHLAIASNNRASAIYSFDKKLRRAGKVLQLPMGEPF
jgi:predicted nucleic acid-binding protein